MKLGVLLMNTGTADEPTVEAIARYLGEFLMDPAIISAPYFIRKPLVQHICKTRPKRTVDNYREFWTPEGSPFMIASKAQATHLQETGRPRGARHALRQPKHRRRVGAAAASRMRHRGAAPLLPHAGKRLCRHLPQGGAGADCQAGQARLEAPRGGRAELLRPTRMARGAHRGRADGLDLHARFQVPRELSFHAAGRHRGWRPVSRPGRSHA